jgi:DNA-binding NtrC family response regulator
MSRGRVLLLEDDPALRGLLEEALTSEGLEVQVCDSFAALQASAAAGGGDLVVADFWGGAQRELDEPAREQMRELSRLLPVVLLTGRTWAVGASAESVGVRSLIRKPFDLGDLLEAVDEALSERG